MDKNKKSTHLTLKAVKKFNRRTAIKRGAAFAAFAGLVIVLASILFSFVRRKKLIASSSTSSSGLIKTLANDYSLTENATFPLLGLIFTLFQGLILGGVISTPIAALLSGQFGLFITLAIASPILGILLLILIRMIIEAESILLILLIEGGKYLRNLNKEFG